MNPSSGRPLTHLRGFRQPAAQLGHPRLVKQPFPYLAKFCGSHCSTYSFRRHCKEHWRTRIRQLYLVRATDLYTRGRGEFHHEPRDATNAQKRTGGTRSEATGPETAAGKARSRQNCLVAWTDCQEQCLIKVRISLSSIILPRNADGTSAGTRSRTALVDRLIAYEWRLRRHASPGAARLNDRFDEIRKTHQ